jgi:hypothetical protein
MSLAEILKELPKLREEEKERIREALDPEILQNNTLLTCPYIYCRIRRIAAVYYLCSHVEWIVPSL